MNANKVLKRECINIVPIYILLISNSIFTSNKIIIDYVVSRDIYRKKISF